MKLDKSLSPCPICGAKSFVSRDVVDGFEFGWSAGCPRFRIDDGIHGIDDFDAPDEVRPTVFFCSSKERAVKAFMDLISFHTAYGGQTSAIRACKLMDIEWEGDA